MASSVTVTETRFPTVKEVIFDWLSHTDGVVTGVASTYTYDGQIMGVLFVPDGGATAPDDQYDVTISDRNSTDLLFGQGANLSGTNSVALFSGLGQVAGSALTCAVTGAGSANGGIVYVYIR